MTNYVFTICLISVIWNFTTVFADEPKSTLQLKLRHFAHDADSSRNPEKFPESRKYSAVVSNATTDPNLPSFLQSIRSHKLSTLLINETSLNDKDARQLEGIKTEQLTISNCEIGDEVAKVLGSIKVERSLTIQQLRMSDEAWMSLGRIECSELYLNKLQMSNAALSGFLSSKSQVKLDASEIRGCTSDGWRALSNIQDLDLRLTDCEFDDQALLHLASSKCRVLFVKNGQISGSTLGSLGALRECLRGLSLSGCPINDQGVQSIGEFSKLGTLDLSNTLVTDKGLQSLPEFTQLKSLDLTGTQVTDDGFRNFKVSPDLRQINVAGTKVSHAWAIEISRQYQDQNRSLGSRPLMVSFHRDPRWPPFGAYCMKGEFHLYK